LKDETLLRDAQMLFATTLAVLTGTALAWFILFLIGLAVFLWFLSWLLFPDAKPIPVGASLRGLDGMNETMAGRLSTFGVRSDHDLIRLTPRGQQELESQIGLHSGEYDRWRQQILDRWREQYLPASFRGIRDLTPDPELGGIYVKKPKEQDDLTKAVGIDKVTASRMNHAGIYTFEQLRLMTPEQQACFKRRFNLGGFDFDKVPEYGVTAEWLAFLRDNPSEQAKRTDSGLLKATPTTSSAESSSLSETATSSFGENSPAASTPESGVVAKSGTDAEIVASSFQSSDALRTASNDTSSIETSGGSNESTENIPTSKLDPELGRIYNSPPPHRDDLTQLDGIDSAIAKKLNAAGIYTTSQVMSLSSLQRASFKRRFDLPHFDFTQWSSSKASSARQPHFPASGAAASSTQAAKAVAEPAKYVSSNTAKIAGFASGVAGVGSAQGSEGHVVTSQKIPTANELDYHVDDKLGRVFTSRPSDADDLKRLPGIDAEKEKQLNEAGIYTYKQLDDMSLAQQTELRVRFGLESANFDEWRQLFYAWSRGLSPGDASLPAGGEQPGWLHSVRLASLAPGVFDGQKLVAYPEQVIYRGTDPAQWGTTVDAPRDGVTKSLHANDIRTDINYVRIRRMDTRESVVTGVKKSDLFSPGPPSSNGWNGVCERFFGAHHLGVYANSIPAEAETKFGLGGWGFGHQVDQNDEQEYCWGGRLIAPTAFEISVGRVGTHPGTVVFRSSDPTIWDQAIRAGANRFSMPIDSVTHSISYVRILRVDTGDGVIVRCDKSNMKFRSEHPRVGWNGLNEHFLGGHHLGVYHRDAPQDVEIAFGEGGWGFGHPFNANDRQAYGWGGSALPETVFEISVLETLPDSLRSELMEN